jgi:hypothetical protein
MKWFKRSQPTAPRLTTPDPEPLAKDLAEAAQMHVIAERQAHTAAIAVHDLRQVNIRNGFAPAIEASIIRKLGGAT